MIAQRKSIKHGLGDFKEEEGTIDLYIGRSLKNRKLMIGYPEKDYGKHAVTHYKVIERLGYVTLIECKLETGRTHQIRAHIIISVILFLMTLSMVVIRF